MARSKGCTIALIVLAALLLIIIIGVVIVWINKDNILEVGINYMTEAVEKEIVRNLPDGYTPEKVSQIIADLKAGIKSDEIASQDIQGLANTFQVAMSDKEIDKDEGRHLLEMMQEALGQDPPEMMDSPEEVLPDSMQAVPDSA